MPRKSENYKKESRHVAQRKRISWLRRKNMFFLHSRSVANEVEAEFLKGLARRMKFEKLYSPTTYVGDIVHGLRKILING